MASNPLRFRKIEDPQSLLPVLKERLPNSCYLYNQVKMYPKFSEDLKFYIVVTSENDLINSDTWIASTHYREDFGGTGFISAPKEISSGKESISKEIQECFSTGGVYDWDKGTCFGGLEKPVSAMIFDIAANLNGHITEVHPCILFCMEIEDALNLEIGSPVEGVLRKLDQSLGTDFILNTWKYSLPGSDKVIQKSIADSASAGIFIDGKCISGVIAPANGFLSSLYTLKEFRGKGFAKLVMQYAFKEFAKDECIPCLTVEVKNQRSIQFHKSLGVKQVSFVDGILIKNLDID